ncbi:MAG: acyl carrier protein [Terriglobales bacterium]|jgi:acyl carrier protein
MTIFTKSDVREFLREFLAGKLKERGGTLSENVSDDCDLLLSGYLDSLGFLELMTSAQDRFQREIEFGLLDPEKMTIFGPLSDFISEQLTNEG